MHSIPSVKKRIRLKANNGKVNIVLKANTSLSAFAVASFPLHRSRHVLARLNMTSEDTRPWRIATRGHVLHSNPRQGQAMCVLARAPLKNRHKTSMEYYEMPRAEANQTPIDFNAS